MEFNFAFNKDLNVLEFRLINPIKNKERWIKIAPPDDNLNYVDIYIDGIQLLPVIEYIEKKKYQRKCYVRQLPYGHNSASWMHITCSKYDFLYLYCCPDCGQPGCCSPTCEVRKDDQFVYWENFRHTNLSRCYDLSFKFDRAQYEQEVEKLRTWARNSRCLVC